MPIARLVVTPLTEVSCSQKKTVCWELRDGRLKRRWQSGLVPWDPIRRHIQKPSRFRVDDLRPTLSAHHQYAAGQIFHHPRQISTYTRVLLQCAFQLRVCSLQFQMKSRDFRLQLRVRPFERTRRLGERQKRPRQILLCRHMPFACDGRGARSLPGSG